MTHGVLTTGGIIALTVGGLILIDTGFLAEGVNVFMVLLTVLLVAGTFIFVLRKVMEARRRPYAAGEDAVLMGRPAQVRERLAPTGLVFVDGALWQATSKSGPVDVGSTVRVVGMDGLRLLVEAIPDEQPSAAPAAPPKAAPNQ
jgi:membrane-bound serine protease (ClpP class)